jgi:FixJ family two-component response regulator
MAELRALADVFLDKPFSAAKLLESVAQALKSKRP